MYVEENKTARRRRLEYLLERVGPIFRQFLYTYMHCRTSFLKMHVLILLPLQHSDSHLRKNCLK